MTVDLPLMLKATLLKGEYALRQQHWEAAEQAFREVLRQRPTHVGALYGLSQVALHFAHAEAALKLLETALAQAPDHALCLFAKGNACWALRNIPQALQCYQQVLQQEPENVAALNNLAVLTTELGQWEPAQTYLEKALAIASAEPRLLQNLGVLYAQQAQHAKASDYFYQALKINPHQPELFHLLGRSLMAQGDFARATLCHQGALNLSPDTVAYHLAVAERHLQAYRLDFARFHYQKVLQLDQACFAAYENLANLEAAAAEPELALNWLEQAMVYFPDDTTLPSRWLTYAQNVPDFSTKMWQQRVQDWYQTWGVPVSRPGFAKHGNPHDLLKVAYTLTPWLFYHRPFDWQPLLTQYQSDNFALLILFEGEMAPEIVTWFDSRGLCWKNTQTMSDTDLVAYCREQAIDILVDLVGHTGHNRLLALSQYPAPLVVIGPGVNHTTGLKAIRLTDVWLTPKKKPVWSSEKLEYLPAAWCWQPPSNAPSLTHLPLLTEKVLTLGYHGPMWRLNHAVFDAWSQILKALPKSRVFLCMAGLHQNDMVILVNRAFESRGISSERYQMSTPEQWASRGDFYQRLDLLLEPFPNSDIQALAEALWQGVPFVAMNKGQRWGCVLLGTLGMTPWIAQQDYVSRVVKFANQPAVLQTLRKNLRGRFAQSLICDIPKWVANVENVYHKLWTAWCQRSI